MIVEIRDSNDKLLERKRFFNFPITIGRAYENEIIIDDIYVCPKHMIIDKKDSNFVISDQDSLNGIIDKKTAVKFDFIEINENFDLILGETQVKLIIEQKSLEPTKVLPFKNDKLKKQKSIFKSLTGAISLMVLYGFISTIESVYFTAVNNQPNYIVQIFIFSLLYIAILSSLWVFPWAIINRIVNHKSEYSTHVVVFIAYLFLGNLFYLLNYWLHAQLVVFTGYFLPILLTIFISFLLYTHLKICLPTTNYRSLFYKAVTLPLLGLITFTFYGYVTRFDSIEYIPFNVYSIPKVIQLKSEENLDNFIYGTKTLEKEIDEEFNYYIKNNNLDLNE